MVIIRLIAKQMYHLVSERRLSHLTVMKYDPMRTENTKHQMHPALASRRVTKSQTLFLKEVGNLPIKNRKMEIHKTLQP